MNFSFDFIAFFNKYFFDDFLRLFLALFNCDFNLIVKLFDGLVLDYSADNSIRGYQLSVWDFFDFFLLGKDLLSDLNCLLTVYNGWIIKGDWDMF